MEIPCGINRLPLEKTRAVNSADNRARGGRIQLGSAQMLGAS